ncbi:protein of unknown function (plasmid) [Cupriavidus taiwanensis]|uniref:Uncharacterized protein n=1 Tax=Cupriavidus taiwanensis TaxID=164546 RepID=A0A375ISZ7_9BURK|nr:protein of unknown function [Cupriavidus taiwanensis]
MTQGRCLMRIVEKVAAILTVSTDPM